jgi:hypothetical protein
MFCPLCLAEYRDGIIQCRKCRTALVSSLSEAKESSKRLWKGNRRRTLDSILTALDVAAVPSHVEETVNNSARGWLLGIPLRPPKSTFEYEVRVLCTDEERAHVAIEGLETDSAPSIWNQLNWEALAKRFWTTYRDPNKRTRLLTICGVCILTAALFVEVARGKKSQTFDGIFVRADFQEHFYPGRTRCPVGGFPWWLDSNPEFDARTTMDVNSIYAQVQGVWRVRFIGDLSRIGRYAGYWRIVHVTQVVRIEKLTSCEGLDYSWPAAEPKQIPAGM